MQNPELKERRKTLRVRCSAGEQRTNILGVGISAISMTDAIYYTDKLLQGNTQGYICVTGVHGVMEAQYDERLRSILNSSFLTTPDGMPTVWLGRLHGFTNMRRVSGPEYMIEVCKLSMERGYKHFLYGGKPGTAEILKQALLDRFPTLQITGIYTPPFRPLTPEEEVDLERQIKEAQPDVLWCGISTPKQERFMARYCGKLAVKLMVGVGAAFDIHSGNTKDAPDWIKDAGMHWFVRMIRDPKRLAGRYIKNNPKFLWLTGLQLSGLRKYFILQPAKWSSVAKIEGTAAQGSQRLGSEF
jgi:N-acetylglucosaminyldiphosphoundecaprenol N-acetyl-beta-D-mannosaminyltransferase